eukprot:5111615-Amphidinium_carterae.2
MHNNNTTAWSTGHKKFPNHAETLWVRTRETAAEKGADHEKCLKLAIVHIDLRGQQSARHRQGCAKSGCTLVGNDASIG